MNGNCDLSYSDHSTEAEVRHSFNDSFLLDWLCGTYWQRLPERSKFYWLLANRWLATE